MKKSGNRKRITPEMLAALSADEQREAMLLLEVLSRPKLARISGAWPPVASPEDGSLKDAIEAANKRWEALTPEQRAEEVAQQERDEDELLKWVESPGKGVELHPITQAHLRLARDRRNPPADPAAVLRQEYESLKAVEPAKPAEPEVKQEQGEALKPPVIEIKDRQPRDIFEALNRPTRDPVCIGESLGSWRR